MDIMDPEAEGILEEETRCCRKEPENPGKLGIVKLEKRGREVTSTIEKEFIVLPSANQ